VETLYEDLEEGNQYEIVVRVRDYSRTKEDNRAFELSLEDSNGTRFPFIVWEKSEEGRNYNWQNGCWYRLSGVSINNWPSGKVLHGTTSLGIEKLEIRQSGSQVNLLYLTDSHLGKSEHSYSGSCWPVSPVDGFRTAIERAIQENVNAVIHGGDIFHNPGSGIEDEDVTVCRESLIKLAEYGIPFYFIYGNHERQTGRQIMERFVDDGLAVHLGPRYEVIDDAVAVYGVDYRSNWSDFVFDLESGTGDLPTILCVHQSIAPFTASNNPDSSVSSILEASNVPLDLVVSGHTHSRLEHQYDGLQALSGGATARVGESQDDLMPSAELVTVQVGQITSERTYL
jgi:predicted phosphodiesterase